MTGYHFLTKPYQCGWSWAERWACRLGTDMLWDLESVEEALKPHSDQHVFSSCNLSPEFQLVLKGNTTTSIKVLWSGQSWWKTYKLIIKCGFGPVLKDAWAKCLSLWVRSTQCWAKALSAYLTLKSQWAQDLLKSNQTLPREQTGQSGSFQCSWREHQVLVHLSYSEWGMKQSYTEDELTSLSTSFSITITTGTY